MGTLDVIIFFGFIACVLFVGMFKSKGEKTSSEHGADDYFLAGRGLSWWLIGFSLIAANISAEQFVGMSGQGAGLEGLSCASWEWIAAIALVVVAFSLLPYFLRTGITTIPEFLEVRYNHWARMLMTVSMMGILVVASLIGVTYAGSLVMMQLFQSIGWHLPFWTCCLIMGGISGAYVLFGGLKACAWADLVQGSALILGGAVIAWFAIHALGGAEAVTGWTANAQGALTASPMQPSPDGWLATFKALNAPKMAMGRPATDMAMPWTILIIGIWIPNFYYWGLNQYITQRILGSGSLAEGQKGIVLAASLKLLIPFLIVIPGIIAFNLFAPDMKQAANQDFKEKYVVAAEHGTLGANVRIDLGSTPAAQTETIASLALTPAQVGAVEKHNAAIETAKAAGADAGAVKTVTLSNYKYDTALGLLITKLIPKGRGILGFVLAALLGAIVSSLAAVLNATSTLLTMDIFKRYMKPDATPKQLVGFGRGAIVALMVVGIVVASLLSTDSIFAYIQQMQLYVSPGIVAVFIFGLLNRRGARWIGATALLVSPLLYFIFTRFGWAILPAGIRAHIPTLFGYYGIVKGAEFTGMHYLWAASYTLILTLALMFILGACFKMPQPVSFESSTKLNMTPSRPALAFGLAICAITVALYVIFW